VWFLSIWQEITEAQQGVAGHHVKGQRTPKMPGFVDYTRHNDPATVGIANIEGRNLPNHRL
jgi:hypothetical protein